MDACLRFQFHACTHSAAPGTVWAVGKGGRKEEWLIINGVDLGINQGRESRRASSRANGKKRGIGG